MWGNDKRTVEVLEEMQRNSASETSTTDTVAGDRESSNHVQQVSSGRQVALMVNNPIVYSPFPKVYSSCTNVRLGTWEPQACACVGLAVV